MQENRTVYKHVAVIGVDGMGRFNSQTDTPRIDEIFKNGAVSWSALSMDPTISAENWGAMLLGATPIVHGLTNSIVGRREYKNEALPSVFKRIRKAMPDAFLASYSKWNPINYGIIEHDIDVEMATADNDSQLTDKIVECVEKKPVFLFVQFDNVDGAGHHFGYGEKGYLDKITETDGHIGRIFDAYAKAGILNDTLFVVTADHGGIRKGHGGYMDSEKYIFFGAAGKGVQHGQVGYMQTRDVSAIVLYALGLDVPEFDEKGFTSQIPSGIFPDYKGEYRKAEPRPFNIAGKPTPVFDAHNGLSSFIPEDRIKLAMFLDNDLADASGKCTSEEYGTVKYYSTGVYGSRAEFGSTGHAVIKGIHFGSDSFTVAVWLKIDRSIDEAPAICANKDWWWQNRDCLGFSLAMRCSDTVFNIGTGDDCVEITTPFPDEISEGWVHHIVSVDKEKKELRFYYNFKLIHTVELPEQFLGECDNYDFTVGNDGPGTYNNVTHNFIFNIDDMFIFGGAFGDDDVNKLADYYKGVLTISDKTPTHKL